MKLEEFFEKQLKTNKRFREINEDKDFQFYSDVSGLITEARLHAGLTQEQLAKKIGTKQPSVARIEKGTGLPSLSFLLKIAHALDTHLIAPKFGFMEKNISISSTVKMISVSSENVEKPEIIRMSMFSASDGKLVDNNKIQTGTKSSIHKI